jgi:hypothetical protein
LFFKNSPIIRFCRVQFTKAQLQRHHDNVIALIAKTGRAKSNANMMVIHVVIVDDVDDAALPTKDQYPPVIVAFDFSLFSLLAAIYLYLCFVHCDVLRKSSKFENESRNLNPE